jgi:hypothetical protein
MAARKTEASIVTSGITLRQGDTWDEVHLCYEDFDGDEMFAIKQSNETIIILPDAVDLFIEAVERTRNAKA